MANKPMTLERFESIMDPNTPSKLLINYDKKTDIYEEVTNTHPLRHLTEYAPDYFVIHCAIVDGTLEIEAMRPDVWFKENHR